MAKVKLFKESHPLWHIVDERFDHLSWQWLQTYSTKKHWLRQAYQHAILMDLHLSLCWVLITSWRYLEVSFPRQIELDLVQHSGHFPELVFTCNSLLHGLVHELGPALGVSLEWSSFRSILVDPPTSWSAHQIPHGCISSNPWFDVSCTWSSVFLWFFSLLRVYFLLIPVFFRVMI